MAATDYDFNLNRNQIIERAFSIIGVLTPGESLEAEEYDRGHLALNTLMKEWNARNVWLWKLEEKSVSVTGQSVTLGTDPSIIGVDKVWYVENNQDIPVELITWRRYQDITRKTTGTGTTPSVVTINYDKSTPTLYVWPPTSSATTIKMLAIVRIQDLDTASANADVPQRALKALVYGLASDLADDYGRPLAERKYVTNKYEEAFAYLKT